MPLKLYFLFLLVFLFPVDHMEQRNWELKVNKDGIKIYMRPSADSPVKELKVECTLQASLTQVVAVLLDVNATGEWVYETKSATLLKKVSPSELYYYSEVNVPWPASNRDFVAHIKVKQDPHTKIVTIDAPNTPDMVPRKEDVVRITQATGKWILVPAGEKLVKVEYYLQVDPGGSLPAWLVNMFATKGPHESFKKLKKQVKSPVYSKSHLPFIVD